MDVLVLAIMTACGLLSLPPPVVLIGAVLLTALSARRKFEIARAHPQVGSGRILATALFLSLANNTLFAALSFILGSAIALLV